MMTVRRLRSNERGVTAIETAFAMPVLVVMLWMLVQLGQVYRAMSGIQHALGEGARLATLYPTPDNEAIEDKILDAVYGIGPGHFEITEPSPGTEESTGASYLDLTVSYTQDTDLLLFPGPTITVTRSKRVWVSAVA
jgi:hypothetical protein